MTGQVTVDPDGPSHVQQFSWVDAFCFLPAALKSWCHSLQLKQRSMHVQSGTSDAILLSRLVSWMTGKRTVIWLYTDSSGARGILQRRGVGRLRHLSCRILWLQALVETGTVKLSSIAGSMNPADVGNKTPTSPKDAFFDVNFGNV